MRLLHEIAIFQTVTSKVIISLFETVRLSVSISLRNFYNSLNSIKREIPTRELTDNAGNEVYRVSGIIRWPEGWDF